MTLPYSKKREESAEAFEAFAKYRDMGPGRSMRVVAESLGKSEALLGRWSSKYQWVRRAHAYDAEVDRRKRLTDLHEIERMRKRHIKAALALQNLGLTELTKMAAEAKRLKKKRSSIDDKLVVDIIERGAKLERLVRGEPGEIVQSAGGEGLDLSDLSLSELQQLRSLRAKVKLRQAREAEATSEDDSE